MNGPEQEVGFDLPDFGVEGEEITDRLLGEETQQQGVLREIVIECPVVIEFVGSSQLPEARDEVISVVMDQIAGAVGRA